MMDAHQIATISGAAVGLLGIFLGGAVRYVRFAVRSELADFLLKLNGTYVRSQFCEPRCADLTERLDVLSERFEEHARLPGHATAMATFSALDHRVGILEQWKERF